LPLLGRQVHVTADGAVVLSKPMSLACGVAVSSVVIMIVKEPLTRIDFGSLIVAVTLPKFWLEGSATVASA
jgi:hypothetical protein